MKQLKHKIKKSITLSLIAAFVVGSYFAYDYYLFGGNPWKRFYNQHLYSKIPYLQMINITRIKEAKNVCVENGGEWKLKKTCGQSTFDKNHPTLDDYDCYKHYKDGGKPCNSSSQCEGYCRFNDLIIQPLVGTCDETNEPTCCNDIIENQNDTDFTKCY